MKPSKITTISPLAAEYLEQKKRIAQNKKAALFRKHANVAALPEDVVTLSSENPDLQNISGKKKPSKPVTFEEKQALNAEFSIRA